MSIADQITRLQNAKANIKTSIENKGVAVSDNATLDSYPSLIDSIEVGEGGGSAYVNPDFYEVRTQNGTNYDQLFRGYNGPEIDVSNWDTSKLTSASYCFADCKKSFDISKWDLSSLTNAYDMFYAFTNNNTYIDLSVLDFSKVNNVSNMFQSSNTDYLDVRNINLTGATKYEYLFYSCNGTELDLSNWDISNVTSLNYAFNGSTYTKIDLTGWKTTNVKNFSYTFYGYTTYLTHLIIPDWDMTNATSTSSFIYTSRSQLKYVDLSRSNDKTINTIATMLPTKTATDYGEILIPADTSQSIIDALITKYWKPVGFYDLVSTELVFELDEIKPGKTTKVYHNPSSNNPWYGDDRAIEFISSDESIATVNGNVITGVSEGSVEISARNKETQVVLGSKTLTISETDNYPNLIKFKTNGKESGSTFIKVNGTSLSKSKLTYDSTTGICSYDPGKQITSIKFSDGGGYINEIIKFNFNAANITNMESMFQYYEGTILDLSDWDTSNITNMYQAFEKAKNLITIDGVLDCLNLSPNSYMGAFSNAFDLCANLETLYLKNIYKNSNMFNSAYWSIRLGDTKVKDECLLYIINELPDLYNDKGLTKTDQIVLTLPPTNTLTAEQVQPAIDRGWTVANCNF